MNSWTMNVLLVDDDEVFLDYMVTELMAIGEFNLSRATSAAEALDVVHNAEVPFDCFLLDIDMPGMDGIELCRVLRRDSRTIGVPIIMVTVLSAIEKMELAFNAGATDYLNKPLLLPEVRGRMQMAMAKLAEEKARKSLLTSIVCDVPVSVGTSMKPLNRPDVVDRAAIENYAFRVGAAELCSRTLFGVVVSNIDDLFATRDNASFKMMLAELSEVIIDALGPGHKMLSYLGSGEFAVILGKDTPYDIDRVHEEISALLNVYANRSRFIGEIVPTLKLGVPVNEALFACAEPDELICIATGLAGDIGTEIVPARMTQSARQLTSVAAVT